MLQLKLAEAFVDLAWNTGKFDSDLARIRAVLAGLKGDVPIELVLQASGVADAIRDIKQLRSQAVGAAGAADKVANSLARVGANANRTVAAATNAMSRLASQSNAAAAAAEKVATAIAKANTAARSSSFTSSGAAGTFRPYAFGGGGTGSPNVEAIIKQHGLKTGARVSKEVDSALQKAFDEDFFNRQMQGMIASQFGSLPGLSKMPLSSAGFIIGGPDPSSKPKTIPPASAASVGMLSATAMPTAAAPQSLAMSQIANGMHNPVTSTYVKAMNAAAQQAQAAATAVKQVAQVGNMAPGGSSPARGIARAKLSLDNDLERAGRRILLAADDLAADIRRQGRAAFTNIARNLAGNADRFSPDELARRQAIGGAAASKSQQNENAIAASIMTRAQKAAQDMIARAQSAAAAAYAASAGQDEAIRRAKAIAAAKQVRDDALHAEKMRRDEIAFAAQMRRDQVRRFGQELNTPPSAGGGGGLRLNGLMSGFTMGAGLPFASTPQMMAGQILGRGLAGSISTGIEQEASLASLQRISGFGAGQMGTMRSAISGTASSGQNAVPLNELMELAQVGARQGIAQQGGVEGLAAFTKNLAQLKTIINEMPADQLADKTARVLTEFKLGPQYVRGFGSALAALADQSTASAGDILDITRRLGGFAESANLGIHETMALAAALVDVGVSNEVAGTSLSQLFRKMGAESQKFAAMVGMDAGKFRDAYREGPIKALSLVIGKLRQMDDTVEKMEALKALNLTGARTAGTLQQLATAFEKVGAFTKVTSDQFGNASKLVEGVKIEANKTAAALVRLENSGKSLGAALMSHVARPLNLSIDALARLTARAAGVVGGAEFGGAAAPAAEAELPALPGKKRVFNAETREQAAANAKDAVQNLAAKKAAEETARQEMLRRRDVARSAHMMPVDPTVSGVVLDAKGMRGSAEGKAAAIARAEADVKEAAKNFKSASAETKLAASELEDAAKDLKRFPTSTAAGSMSMPAQMAMAGALGMPGLMGTMMPFGGSQLFEAQAMANAQGPKDPKQKDLNYERRVKMREAQNAVMGADAEKKKIMKEIAEGTPGGRRPRRPTRADFIRRPKAAAAQKALYDRLDEVEKKKKALQEDINRGRPKDAMEVQNEAMGEEQKKFLLSQMSEKDRKKFEALSEEQQKSVLKRRGAALQAPSKRDKLMTPKKAAAMQQAFDRQQKIDSNMRALESKYGKDGTDIPEKETAKNTKEIADKIQKLIEVLTKNKPNPKPTLP